MYTYSDLNINYLRLMPECPTLFYSLHSYLKLVYFMSEFFVWACIFYRPSLMNDITKKTETLVACQTRINT